MADVAKGWAIGDTVWVHYTGSITNYFTPISRVVKEAIINSSTNESVVNFITGESVIDGATVRVYTTQALCAACFQRGIISPPAAPCSQCPSLCAP